MPYLTAFHALVPCLYEFFDCTSHPSRFVPLVLVYRSPCEGEDCYEIIRNSTSAPSFRRGLFANKSYRIGVIFTFFINQPWRLNVADAQQTQKKKCKNTEHCGYEAEPGHEFCCGCLAGQNGISYVAMRARLEKAKQTERWGSSHESVYFVKKGW